MDLDFKDLDVNAKRDNLTLALCSAQSIGCNTHNIDVHGLSEGKPHLVLDLLWQIIRVTLIKKLIIVYFKLIFFKYKI